MMKVGEYIRQMREELHMSRKTLADRVGMSLTFMANLELGKTESIQAINSMIEILEQLLAEKNMQTIKIKYAARPSIWDVLKTRGLNLNVNRHILLDISGNYYSKYDATIAQYLDEYDQEFGLRTILKNKDINELDFRNDIALDYTYKLTSMAISYIEKNAKNNNIDTTDVLLNELYIIEWDEILSQELHNEIEQKISKWRPTGNIDAKYLALIDEYMRREN